MILPMMGLLFVIFTIGVLCAVCLFMVRPWRRFAPFAGVPILASIGALVLSWGLAVGLEQIFASQSAGGIGFFGGYALGAVVGAALGYWLALRSTRRPRGKVS